MNAYEERTLKRLEWFIMHCLEHTRQCTQDYCHVDAMLDEWFEADVEEMDIGIFR